MERLIGSDVEVHLKSNDVISGKLFDVEDSYVYVQRNIERFITIPKENIKYYVSRSFQNATSVSNVESYQQPRMQHEEPMQKTGQITELEVFVDDEFVTAIPVPPTFNLLKFNDSIMKVALGNPDVQAILSNRVQKAVEYSPGKIMFFTSGDEDAAPVYNPVAPTSPNTFAMGGVGNGNPASAFVNPSQMVTRLNKITQEKKDEETEM